MGAGVGGWAYPETPVLGKLVRTLVQGADSKGELGEPVHDLRQMANSLDTSSISAATRELARVEVAGQPRTVATNVSMQRGLASPSDQIAIASYNIQVFGSSKLADLNTMQYLVAIVRRFDLVAIQEVRSQDEQLIPKFVQMINSDGRRYQSVVGPRLGRTNSKEQYAFIYNSDRIEHDPRSVLTIQDPTDQLHRPPLLTRFRVRTADPAAGFTFWLMDTHTDPDEVPTEVDALAVAFQSVQRQGWGEDDLILLGDLNASESQLGNLARIPGIRYVISGVPTNTRGTKTYDNIIMDGRTTTEFTGAAECSTSLKSTV